MLQIFGSRKTRLGSIRPIVLPDTKTNFEPYFYEAALWPRICLMLEEGAVSKERGGRRVKRGFA